MADIRDEEVRKLLVSFVDAYQEPGKIETMRLTHQALGKLGTTVIRHLVTFMTDDAPGVRWGAMLLLSRFPDSVAVPELTKLLDDQDEIVRRNAAWAINLRALQRQGADKASPRPGCDCPPKRIFVDRVD